jgi:hypothetical protein
MVLAMHVIGDGAAHGDEARSRRDRQEPAARHDQLEQLIERDAGFTAQHAAGLIEGDETVESARPEQGAVLVQAAIAVAAALAEREHRRAAGLGQLVEA